MATYRIETTEKKNVLEIEHWQKDGVTIKRLSGFRWGTGWINTEPGETLDIDPVNENGVNVYDYDFELDSLDDGWYGDWEFPDDMAEEERERLMELWDEESYSGFEEEGWSNEETECWFNGPLSIELTEGDAKEQDNVSNEASPAGKWPF